MPLVSLVIVLLLVRHTKLAVRPRPGLGFAVLGVSLLGHLAASLARVNFASGFSLIGVLAGLVLVLWGAGALRRLWFPLALLAFMVPLPEVTISQMNFRLKLFAADAGVALANLAGIVAEQKGNEVLLLEGKKLVIANVCNGLRTLISLLAFGALYAYVCRLRGGWRLFMFAMSVPVAVVSNAIRVLALIVVADVWSVEIATGWFHDLSGLLIYVVALVIMFSLEKLILWARRVAGRPARIEPLFAGAARGPEDDDQVSRLARAGGTSRGFVAGLLIVAAAAGAVWLARSVPSTWTGQMARSAVPDRLVLGGQAAHGYDLTMDQQTLDILETRDYLYRRYERSGAPPSDLCVIFSSDNRKGTHPPDVCLEGGGSDIIGKGNVTLRDVAGRPDLPCREVVSQTGPYQDYFLYTYRCGDRYSASFWVQQWVIFVNGLTRRDASGALIRVSTPVAGDLKAARARASELMSAAIPHLDRALK